MMRRAWEPGQAGGDGAASCARAGAAKASTAKLTAAGSPGHAAVFAELTQFPPGVGGLLGPAAGAPSFGAKSPLNTPAIVAKSGTRVFADRPRKMGQHAPSGGRREPRQPQSREDITCVIRHRRRPWARCCSSSAERAACSPRTPSSPIPRPVSSSPASARARAAISAVSQEGAADAHCSDLAVGAGIKGKTWHAYLSTSGPGGVSAKDRIGKGPWYNVRGVMVAAGVDDLHSANNKLNKENSVSERGHSPSTASATCPTPTTC